VSRSRLREFAPPGVQEIMTELVSERRWFWATLMLSSISIVAVVFAFWELVENHFSPT